MSLLVKTWSYKFPSFTGAFQAYVDEFPKTVKGEIPGMKELLDELKGKGIGLYGLSNWSSETFAKVPRLPVIDMLDGYVLSGDVHLLKPDPAIYMLLMDKYSLKADECVFVDDRRINVMGAKAIGMNGIVFKDAPTLKKQLGRLVKKEAPKKGLLSRKKS